MLPHCFEGVLGELFPRVHYLENLLKEAEISYKVTEVIDSDQSIMIEENQGDRILQEAKGDTISEIVSAKLYEQDDVEITSYKFTIFYYYIIIYRNDIK